MYGCSVWKQPTYNVKNPLTNVFIKPINRKQSPQMSCFRFFLSSSHWGGKVPPICDALCPISINTALSEKLWSAITGDIYNVSTKETLQVLCFGMHKWTGVAIISPPLSRGLCGSISFSKEISWKKSAKSPKCLGDNSGALKDKMSQIKRLRHFVVGCNNEYSSHHLFPTSEPLNAQRI